MQPRPGISGVETQSRAWSKRLMQGTGVCFLPKKAALLRVAPKPDGDYLSQEGHLPKPSCLSCLAKLDCGRTLFLLEKLLLGQIRLISVLHCSVCCMYLIYWLEPHCCGVLALMSLIFIHAASWKEENWCNPQKERWIPTLWWSWQTQYSLVTPA